MLPHLFIHWHSMITDALNPLIDLNNNVIVWLDTFSQVSPSFNRLVFFVSLSPLMKGIPVMGLIWYFWFRDTDNSGRTRRVIVAGIIGCLFALLLARTLNNMIVHPRPIAAPALHFLQPLGVHLIDPYEKWIQHSFPSDHASLFFSLATIIFILSRSAGIAAFAYISIAICLPRMYLGLHYPADIIGGALLGIGCVLLFSSMPIWRLYANPINHAMQTHSATFQSFMFVLSVEMCFLFDDIRNLLRGLWGFAG